MANYLVTFQISIQSHRLKQIVDSIHNEPGWARINANTYIVDSTKTAPQLRDVLKEYLINGESLLVAELSDNAAWTGLSTEVGDWIKKTL
jgi:hypothetical protein